MRKMWMVILIGGVATSVGLTAQGGLSLRLAAAKGKSVPVFMSAAPDAAPIGVTSLNGDIALAAAPDKNGEKFIVFMTAEKCPQQQIFILPKGSPEAHSCQKDSNDPCRCGPPVGEYTWGMNATIGSGGSAWTNPWVLTPIIGAGIGVPVVITQGGSSGSAATPTPIAGPAPSPTPTPNPTPAPTPTPTFPTFNATNVNLSANPGSINTCNLFQMSFPSTGQFTFDSSGQYLILTTDQTGTTLRFVGRATVNNAQSATLGMSEPHNWTSPTSQRNLRATLTSGQANASGSGSFTVDFTFLGGGTPGPQVNCIDRREYMFSRP